MDFVAIDVETANADMASICQIGIAKYVAGRLTHEWVSYVNPEDYFDDVNISVHGITEATVAGAPAFSVALNSVRALLDGAVMVSHTHFDRIAMHQAADRHHVQLPPVDWLDSARVARRAWPSVSSRGYGLRDVCAMLGYDFAHHDALADAKASAHVLLAAATETGLDVAGWMARVKKPITPGTGSGSSSPAITRDGNPEGAMLGEVLVFTGALQIPRREAADLAASIGCQVASSVTKATTLLVVGDQDVKRLSGHEKSSKHRKAEELIQAGASIRILRETDFKELVRISHET